MKRFNEIKDLVMSLEADFEKFYEKGNNAAGTRVRKGMQELKNLAQDIRVEVQDIKNKGKTTLLKNLKGMLSAFLFLFNKRKTFCC